jgi:hypothetical protein
MRIFEFAGDDNLDKFVVLLKNFIGRNASKKTPAKYNWASINRLAGSSGIELMADYETFKSIYDSSPQLQMLVKNFNANGLELNVPGAPDSAETPDGTAQPQDSQAAVDKMAASAAPKQLAGQA